MQYNLCGYFGWLMSRQYLKEVVKGVNDLEQNSANSEDTELEDIFNKYANDYDINYDIGEAQKNIAIEKYVYYGLHDKGLENTNVERLLDITISESRMQYDIKQSIETRVGLLLALWGVLISALMQLNIPLNNVHIMSDLLAHMGYRIIAGITLVGQALFGVSSLVFTFITLKSYGYSTMSLRDKEKNFKGAVDDKYISMVQLLDTYTNCWLKNSGAIAKKSKYYKMLLVSISLFTVFVVLGYINTL